MMRRQGIRLFFGGLLLSAAFACADQQDSLLEEAKFLLDTCDPRLETSLPNCTSAIGKANSMQAGDPTNVDAALIESSAQTGLARMDFLSFASDLSELEDSGADDFAQFRRFISDYEEELNADQGATGLEIDLAELRTAVTVFDGVLDDAELDGDGVAVDPDQRAAFFQLGMLQALDAFIRPVKLASGGVANIANLTEGVWDVVLANFLNADNNLLRGGGDEDSDLLSDILRPVRENYCRCSLQDPPGDGNTGFTIDCLQDLMRCELYDGNEIEQDYNSNGEVAVGDCDTLLDPPGLEACGSANTE